MSLVMIKNCSLLKDIIQWTDIYYLSWYPDNKLISPLPAGCCQRAVQWPEEQEAEEIEEGACRGSQMSGLRWSRQPIDTRRPLGVVSPWYRT